MFREKKSKYFLQITMWIIVLFIIFPFIVFADNGNSISTYKPMPNPSAAYCRDLGYEFVIKDTPTGQMGVCKFSDSKEEAPAWDFLRGKEATEKSYCIQEGYKMKIIDDPKKCGVSYAPGHGCMVCILEDGKEVEVSNLLKIEKARRLTNPCNIDGICLSPETPQNCPQDCVVAKQELPSKSTAKNIVLAIIGMSIVIIIIITAYYFLIRKKEDNNANNFQG